MNNTEAIVYLVMLSLSLLLPLIPAIIAKRKYRSFWLFYILGLFLFVPMLVISICIGNKYDDEVLSKRGIKILIAAVVSFLLISPVIDVVEKPINTFVESNLDLWAVDSIKEIPESHIIIMGIGILLVSLLILFLIVLVILMILGKLINIVIDAINSGSASNKQAKIKQAVMNYNGKNAHHVRRLNMVIPIAKKHESFFNKRDKLAKYQTLSLGRVIKIALPLPLICTYLLSTMWFAYWNENHPSWYPFERPGKLLLIVFFSLFILLVLLSKPIANMKYRKSLKYDRIDEEKGYTRAMQEVLPELQDKIFRYKTLRNMRMVLKMDLTNDIGIAACFAQMLNKGIALGKVAAIASVPIMAGSVLFDYLKDSVKDPYMPK